MVKASDSDPLSRVRISTEPAGLAKNEGAIRGIGFAPGVGVLQPATQCATQKLKQ